MISIIVTETNISWTHSSRISISSVGVYYIKGEQMDMSEQKQEKKTVSLFVNVFNYSDILLLVSTDPGSGFYTVTFILTS